MAQASQSVSASQSGSAYASDVNDALQAVQTNHSGGTAPSYIQALQWWADTSSNFLKLRDAGNTSFYSQIPLDKSMATYVGELIGVYGLGTTAPLKSGDNLNSVDPTGLYRITTSTSNNTYGNGSVLVLNRGGGVVDQLVISVTDSKVYFRNTQNNGSLWTLKATLADLNSNVSSLEAITKEIIQGSPPSWLSGTTVSMKALTCLDSLRTSSIVCSASTLNFGTSGLNGLDTGSIASNTWYYIYAILNPTTLATGYLASTSSTSPTLPSGFTKFRLLPFVLKTKSASAVLQDFQFFHVRGQVKCEWRDTRADEVLITQSMASSTPYVVDASSSVPPICTGANSLLFAHLWQDTGNSSTWSRISVDAGTSDFWQPIATSSWVQGRMLEIPLYPTTRQFRLRNDASGGGAAACGCIVYSRGYIFNYEGVL